MRSFVAPWSQAGDQVQIRSGFVPGTLPLRVTAPIQRPFAIQNLSDFYPITGRRSMQSFPLSTVAATAISSIAYKVRKPHEPSFSGEKTKNLSRSFFLGVGLLRLLLHRRAVYLLKLRSV
jgi:hypothetical protein